MVVQMATTGPKFERALIKTRKVCIGLRNNPEIREPGTNTDALQNSGEFASGFLVAQLTGETCPGIAVRNWLPLVQLDLALSLSSIRRLSLLRISLPPLWIARLVVLAHALLTACRTW